MQHKAVYLLFCKFTLHVSGANHTHISGVHKTVTTASGTVQLSPSNMTKLATLEGGSRAKNMTSTEAVVTVLCTPDDGCG